MSTRDKEEDVPSRSARGDTDPAKRLESRDKDGHRHKDAYQSKSNGERTRMHKDAYHSKSNGERTRMHKTSGREEEEEEEEEEEGGRVRGSGRGSRYEDDSSKGKRSRSYGDDEGGHHDVRGKRSKSFNGDEGGGWGDGYGWEEEEGWGGRYGSEKSGQRRASEQAAQLAARLAKGKDPATALDRRTRIGGSAAGGAATAAAAGNGIPAESLAAKAGRRKDAMDEGDLDAAEELPLEEEKLAGGVEGKVGGKTGGVDTAGPRVGGSRTGGRYREEEEEMQPMEEDEAVGLGKRGRVGLAVGKGGLAGRLGRYRELEDEMDIGDVAMDGRVRGRGMVGGKAAAAAALGGMRGGRAGYPAGYEEEEELGGMLLDDEMFEKDEDGYATAMMEGRRVMVPRKTPGMAAFAHNPAALLAKHSLASGGVVGGMGSRAMGMKPGGLVRGVGAGLGMGAGVQGLTHPQMMNLPMGAAKMGIDPHLKNTASALGLSSEFVPVVAYVHRELLEFLETRSQPVILGRSGNLLSAPAARGAGLPNRAIASRLMATGGLDDAYADEEAGYEDEVDEGDAGYGEGLEELAVPAHQGGPWLAPRGGADVSMRGAGPSRGVGFAQRAAAAHLGGLGGAAYEGPPGPTRWGVGGVGSRLAGRIAPPGPSAVGGAGAEGYPEEQEEAVPHAPHAPHGAHVQGEGGGGATRGAGAKVPSKYTPRHDGGGRSGDRGERGGSAHGGKGDDGGWVSVVRRPDVAVAAALGQPLMCSSKVETVFLCCSLTLLLMLLL
ncbi:hypothetical protein DUNSADRAFT_6599 [Dunaliella salina]|uniref:Uncharacterized protein n=1 Tax=Dunaliella salina TaxID=3046 RepID=A0ABQ7GN08_DUNSA|nr:hypothetical protein DUNSADRAFT_6599 [Dunaliella salina]|eukprot:KAF5835983.1 hypothetical protein DUNSADRAFT_6599 [Dunaliella salina]